MVSHHKVGHRTVSHRIAKCDMLNTFHNLIVCCATLRMTDIDINMNTALRIDTIYYRLQCRWIQLRPTRASY